MSARVLIADTDRYLLNSYREHLARQGFLVATTSSGLGCIERLREFVPDVLVLEPSLPWGGGDGVLARMREEDELPDVPVILLTFGRDRHVLYQLAPFRVDDYQVKPISARRLVDRICTILKLHKNQLNSESKTAPATTDLSDQKNGAMRECHCAAHHNR